MSLRSLVICFVFSLALATVSFVFAKEPSGKISGQTATSAKPKRTVANASHLPGRCVAYVEGQAAKKIENMVGRVAFTADAAGGYAINYVDDYYAVHLNGTVSGKCYQAIVQANQPTDSGCLVQVAFEIPCG
jgi:hypothetical protein